ncbi:hypothetical protein HMPREF2141_03090 [Bacteroides uniformis]|nr:hypothetical protein HMPREF2141_03090 [Bacteroides uniformis]
MFYLISVAKIRNNPLCCTCNRTKKMYLSWLFHLRELSADKSA